MKPALFTEKGELCIIRVLVRPKSKKAGIIEVSEEALEVGLHAPPLKNKANAELIDILSSVFSVSKSEIAIISGQQSREKFLSIHRQRSFLEQKITALQK